MNRNTIDWHGSICAVVTPFAENGEIDYKLYDRNIELLLEDGVHAIVVAGCTGEAWALTAEEKIALSKRTVSLVNKKVPVIDKNNRYVS